MTGYVNGQWPYPQPGDPVGQYPEVGLDLAQKVAALNDSWVSYRDSRPWPVWESGAIVHFPSVAGFMAAGWQFTPAAAYWMHNGWRELFTVTWETYSAPNGPQVSAWNNGTRWRLSHTDNMFYGTFIAKPMARDGRAAALMVPADTADTAETGQPTADTEPGWDLAATVANLAAAVVDLQQQLAALKGADA